MDKRVRPAAGPQPGATGGATGPVTAREQSFGPRPRPPASPRAGGTPERRRSPSHHPPASRRGASSSTSAARPAQALLNLLRPLTVAAANAVRRSRIELTVYAPAGGVEGTVWFGVPLEEQAVVARLAAAWPSAGSPIHLGPSDAASGTRPPVPLVERAADPAFPTELRDDLSAIGRESALVVPLVDRGTIVGRLSAWSPGDTRPLAQSAMLAVLALGEQAGLTIRDARRLAAAERRAADQATLLQIGRATDPAAPLPVALAALGRAGLGVGGADGCAIEITLDDGASSIVAADESVGDWTHAAATGARHRPASAPALVAAFRSARPRVCTIDDPALGPALGERYRTRRARHLLIAPISLDARVVGVALLAWRGRRSPPETATSLGRDLADQLAVALDRLRLAAALRLRTDLDGATGLPGRRAIASDLDVEIARAARWGRRLAVAVVRSADPSANGAVSRATADLLRATVRAGDRIGRLDDAFLLVLPDTDARQAARVAARICDRAAGALALGVEVAGYPDDGRSAAALITRATGHDIAFETAGSPHASEHHAAPADPLASLGRDLEAALIGTL